MKKLLIIALGLMIPLAALAIWIFHTTPTNTQTNDDIYAQTADIVDTLPIPGSGWSVNSIQTDTDRGNLIIFYTLPDDADEFYLNFMPGGEFGTNAALLFGLIEDLQSITFSVGRDTEAADDYMYRWSITRTDSDAGAGAVTSVRGSQAAQEESVQQTGFIHPQLLSDPESTALRERVLLEIGGLAFNEAYMWHNDGLYYAITGWRPLTSRAELQHYFPHMDLPEQVDDFALSRITVDNGGIFDSVWVHDEPIVWVRGLPLWGIETQFGFTGGKPPLNEPFVMLEWTGSNPPVFALYALYKNSHGQHVGLGAWLPIMIHDSVIWQMNSIPFSTLPEHENIYFRGAADTYYFAQLTEVGPAVRLSFRGNPENVMLDRQWLLPEDVGVLPVSRYALEELVRVFEPEAMLLRYGWDFMSFQ